jgi:3-isopropylmalate dehydrogenase
MQLKITLLPGDGIGGEVLAEAVKVLRATAELCEHEFEFAEYEIGGAAIKKYNTPLPVTTLDACMSADAVLLGAVGAPEFDHLSPGARPEAGLLTLRKALNGYANLRPVTVYEPLAGCSPLRAETIKGADILFVRELLGGLYFGEPRGFQNYGEPTTIENADEAFNTLRYSAEEIERVARIAFKAARARRGKVTSVDKANVLETSQLWRRTVARVRDAEFRDVELEHLYVDACAMHLISNPRRFDVVLTENLFGDILSDEAAVLSGSLGLLASASIGGAVDLYEPVHGSAPDIAGRGLANPIGAILSAAMLLRHTAHLEQEARDLENAVGNVLAAGYRTADLQDPLARGADNSKTHHLSTAEMGARIAETLAETVDMRYAYHAV